MSFSPELLTAAEVFETDRLATAAGINVSTLMENAGRAVADAICVRYASRKTVVVAGGGNNGGDGLVVARLLKERGWEVSVVRLAEFSPRLLKDAELIVDAIFGVGLNRAPEGSAAQAIEAINSSGATVVAVDVPSGVMADSGDVSGMAVRADITVTFFRARPGLFLLPGKALTGEVLLHDIGIPESVLRSISPQCFLNTLALWCHVLPLLTLASHKYMRGHALVSGGPLASTGAAKLAALAALRAGAGLVSVACDAASLPAYAASLMSVMTKPANTSQDYEKLTQDKRVNALLLGPGNGVNDATRARMLVALHSKKPCVLDADALTVLSENRKSLLPLLHGNCVLTPHEGEFARLFNGEGDKLVRARRAASETGCIIVLKGNDTVIVAPDGKTAINTNAPVWLATAGAGDVLSGIVCGLLAQGMPAWEAACAGVWLHGEAAGYSGPGMIAEDLPGLLLRVWAAL